MKALFLTSKGAEKVCVDEILKITGKKPKLKEQELTLTLKDESLLAKICYNARSVYKVFVIKGKEKIEVTSKNLDIRDYIVKDNPPNLKSTVAYAMVVEAKIKVNEVVLDPLCCGGKILIEAAHYLNNVAPGSFWKGSFIKQDLIKTKKKISKSSKIKKKLLNLHGIDSYTGNIKDAKTNLDEAKVNAELNCRSVDWIDYLFEEKSVDKIISYPPSGKSMSTDALYRELFYQATFCLNKKGLIVLLSKRKNLIEKYSERYGFKVGKKICAGDKTQGPWIFKISRKPLR